MVHYNCSSSQKGNVTRSPLNWQLHNIYGQKLSKFKSVKCMLGLLDSLRHAEGRLDLPGRAEQRAGPRLAPRHEEGALLRGPAGVTPLLPPDLSWGAPHTIREGGAGVPTLPLVTSSTSLQSWCQYCPGSHLTLISPGEKRMIYVLDNLGSILCVQVSSLRF